MDDPVLPSTALEPSPLLLAACLDALASHPLPDVIPDEGEPVEAVRWRIMTDDEAEWAFMRLAEIDGELRAVQEHADDMRAKIDRWVDEQVNARRGQYPSLAQSREFFASHLEWYALTEREAKDRKTVALICGDVTTREVKPTVEITDPDALIEWADENGIETVRTRRDVLVTALRQWVTVTPDGSLLLTDADPPEDAPQRPDRVLDAIPGVTVTEAHVTAKVTPR